MFEASQLVFYYAVSPVHMGAGSAIGAIDSPIQREVHTQHPMFAGSGLKGALRHHFNRAWPRAEGDDRKANSLINRIFGPDTSASDFAGALSLSDAQLVALPVRSLKGGFAYVTSPLALARLHRLATQAGIAVDWSVPTVSQNKALSASVSLLLDKTKQQINSEAFEFPAELDEKLKAIAQWIATHALGGSGNSFFADKFKADLVLLNDTDFAHFVRHAMVVEPHVRIDDESGTADDGGLFYVENLPPETLMVGLAQASIERFKKGQPHRRFKCPAQCTGGAGARCLPVPGRRLPGIGGKLLQIGGDATTGRGLVMVQAAQAEGTAMTQTLDQKRAALAWQYATASMAQHGKEYKGLAKGAPALIMNSGLMPTLGVLPTAKGTPQQQLLDDLIRGLSQRLDGQELKAGQGGLRFPKFMEMLQRGESRDYLRYTDEALELLKWIRQFVDAVESTETIDMSSTPAHRGTAQLHCICKTMQL